MFIYPIVVVAGLLIMAVIALTRRQRGWLIPITAMGAALIFGWVFATGTSQASSALLVMTAYVAAMAGGRGHGIDRMSTKPVIAPGMSLCRYPGTIPPHLCL